jgi:hypothetical protein
MSPPAVQVTALLSRVSDDLYEKAVLVRENAQLRAQVAVANRPRGTAAPSQGQNQHTEYSKVDQLCAENDRLVAELDRVHATNASVIASVRDACRESDALTRELQVRVDRDSTALADTRQRLQEALDDRKSLAKQLIKTQKSKVSSCG